LINESIRPHISKVAVLLSLADIIAVIASHYFANLSYHTAFATNQVEIAIIAALALYLFGQMRGLYSYWRLRTIASDFFEVSIAWGAAFGLILVIAFVTKTSENFSRGVMLIWLVLCPTFLMAIRLLKRRLLQYWRSQGYHTCSVAIVGANAVGLKLVNKMANMPWTGQILKGYYDDRAIEHLPIETHAMLAGDFSKLLDQTRNREVDIIYIALDMQEEQRIIDLVNALADTTATVYFIPDFFLFELSHARWISFNGLPLVSIYDTPFAGAYGWVKRIEDIVLASLILIIIAMPMLIIALALKLTSSGPVIFKQHRYGLNGGLVCVWKFRSMRVCENGSTITQAKKGDARITPLGAFLRKTSLDELPQFINVLQGTMSIVGPRPHAIAHNEQYRELIQGYMLRHKVLPGITGLAQIKGWRGETDTLEKMQKRVEYDLQYIQDWSLWLDLKIIFLTILGGFTGKNAY
jgi:putative colanic acid biosynthesis UDP-glucose lipid carrier transferase